MSTLCSLSDPITGELIVEASTVPINSIDIHLCRVESVILGERIITETSVIQTTQVWDISSSLCILVFAYTKIHIKFGFLFILSPDSRWRCLSQHYSAYLCYTTPPFNFPNSLCWVSYKYYYCYTTFSIKYYNCVMGSEDTHGTKYRNPRYVRHQTSEISTSWCHVQLLDWDF